MSITTASAPRAASRLVKKSTYVRSLLNKASRHEEQGVQGAKQTREKLIADFARLNADLEIATAETATMVDDLRLAANILKHRIRSFDPVPKGTIAADALDAVRYGTSPDALDRLATICANAADEGAQSLRDATAKADTHHHDLRATGYAAQIAALLPRHGFDVKAKAIRDVRSKYNHHISQHRKGTRT